MPIGVVPSNGKYLRLEDIKERIVLDLDNIHFAATRVVSLEDTIMGVKMPIEEIARISKYCKEKGIKLHCDGARMWNAAVADDVPLSTLCQYFDSVSLCLSKTLGAPIGSVLVGEKSYIQKANHFKKQNGGGIRQSGILLRMASCAIDQNYSKLARTHELAKNLEKYLIEIGVPTLLPVDTNFVIIDTTRLNFNNDILIANGKKYDVNLRGARILFHYQISDESLENLKKAIYDTHKMALQEDSDGPIVPAVNY